MIRLYVPDRPLAAGGEIDLDGSRHHYLARVVRVRPGTPLELFPGDGHVFPAVVCAVARHHTRVAVGAASRGLARAPFAITLLQPLLKGGRLETVIQKATELGVAGVTLVETTRADVRWRDKVEARRERLTAVAVEAAEQCGRAEVPQVAGPYRLAEALAALPADTFGLVFWEEDRDSSLRAALQGGSPFRAIEDDPPDDLTGAVPELTASARKESGRVAPAAQSAPPAPTPGLLASRRIDATMERAVGAAVLCGPEGGLTVPEVECAAAAGFRRAGLGPRVLRAETAPLVALAIMQYVLGDVR